MDYPIVIGVMYLLQVYKSTGQMLYYDYPILSEGASIDYMTNPMYSQPYPINNQYYENSFNAAPYTMMYDRSNNVMNLPEKHISSTTAAAAPTNNINVNPQKQSIFSLFDRPKFQKPLTINQNTKPDNMNVLINRQYAQPVYDVPSYNQFYEPYFPFVYEPNIPPIIYNNNGFVDLQDRNLYWMPEIGYVEPNQLVSSQNAYPYQKGITIPNKDISSSNDELYKVTLKYASGNQQTGNSSPTKVFKTNFSGDLSKCDMICKCRNIYTNSAVSNQGSTSPNTITQRNLTPIHM